MRYLRAIGAFNFAVSPLGYILIMLLFSNAAICQQIPNKKLSCDTLRTGILREQELRFWTMQNPNSKNKDSVKALLDTVSSHNLNKIKAAFYSSGVPAVSSYAAECIQYFWMLVIRAGKDPKFQNDVVAYIDKKGMDNYEFRSEYAYVVDKRLVLDGKPQMYGTQLKIDTITKTVSYLPVADTANLDKLRKKVNLIPVKEYLAKQEEIIFNR